jgi:signal transduction histidine kinase/Tfp pilus assembly protein PilF
MILFLLLPGFGSIISQFSDGFCYICDWQFICCREGCTDRHPNETGPMGHFLIYWLNRLLRIRGRSFTPQPGWRKSTGRVMNTLRVLLVFSLPALTGFSSEEARDLPQSDQTGIDTLQQLILRPGIPDTLKVNSLISLSWWVKSTDPDLALDYAQEALELSASLGLKERSARAMNNIGVIYWQKGFFQEAMDYLFEAYHVYREVGDSIGIARTHGNMGLIFADQGHYDKALEYYLVARAIYEMAGNLTGLAPVFNNIGLVYQSQGDYAEAEAYHLRSLEIKESLGDRKGIAFSLNNLGLVRQNLGDFDNALEYFNGSLAIRESLPDAREIAITVGNIGYLFLLIGETDQALPHFSRALDIYSAINDQSGLAKTYNHLGRAMMALGRTQAALQYFENSLGYAQNVGLPRLIADNLKDFSLAMADINNYRAAYDFQKRYLSLRDSIYDEEARRRVIELQLMYDRERKEGEIELLKKNNEIGQLNLEKQRILRNYLLLVVALIVGLLVLLLNRYLYITKINRMLREQKEEIFSTNRKLQELNRHLMEQKQKVEELNLKLNAANSKLSVSEKHLIATNATKDKFFSIISHDLRNPFASIVSFSRILKRDIGSLNKQELQELVAELDKSVLKISNLLENLLQWSRSQSGKMQHFPENIAVYEVVRENMNLFSATARGKGIEITDQVSPQVYVLADRNMLDTVIRNLLSNALKYTDKGGKVSIGSELSDGMVCVTVTDTGTGIPEQDQEKLFRPDAFYSTYGTRDEKGSGLGLMLCREFVEKLGGKIWFESKEGKGSRFIFSLPAGEPSV